MSGYQVETGRLHGVALINLRCDESAITRIGATTNLDFPLTPFVASIHGDLCLVRLAPDQWWIRTLAEAEFGVFQRLKLVSQQYFAAVTIISDHFQGFTISGLDSIAVLSQATSLDLDLFPPGTVTRTRFARTGATVFCHDAGPASPPAYDVFVESSYADYVEQWLSVAANNSNPGAGTTVT